MPSPGPADVAQPRAVSQPPSGSKSVHFDTISSSSPPDSKTTGGSTTHGHQSGERVRSPHHDHDEPHASDRTSRKQHHHHRRQASQNDLERSPSPAPSDATLELPPRFDQYGRRRPEKGEDPLADALEDILSGNGPAGKLFSKVTGALG